MSVPNLSSGEIVGGKYAIQRLLGRSEAAATYHAITAPNREVAVKVLDPAVRQQRDFDDQLRRRVAETNTLPPSVATQIVDVGTDPASGAPFVVTDLSPTPSLAHLVELCPLSSEELLAFARSLGRSLGAAHARGILHLSLKPTNVFVGSAPRCDVRLADFGLIVRDRRQSEDVWAAPELTSTDAPPGAASDVYAAALVTLFAMTGRPLRDRSEAARRAPVSALANELGVSLDARLDAPLARALASDPSRRYQSASELAEAIARALGAPAAVFAPIDAAPIVMVAPPQADPPAPEYAALAASPALGNQPVAAQPAFPAEPMLAPQPYPSPEPMFAPQPYPSAEPMFAPQPELSAHPMHPTEPDFARQPGFTAQPDYHAQSIPPAAQSASFGFVPQTADVSGSGTAVVPPPIVSSKMAMIAAAVGVSLLVIGVALSVFTARARSAQAVTSAASASASASASAAALAMTSTASASPARPPPAGASADPTPAPTPATTQTAAGEQPTGLVTVSCQPACDTVDVDGEVVSSFPVKLAAGAHTVTGRRGQHPPQSTSVKLAAGQERTVSFVFLAPSAPARPAAGAPKKPCGKFLKRCD